MTSSKFVLQKERMQLLKRHWPKLQHTQFRASKQQRTRREIGKFLFEIQFLNLKTNCVKNDTFYDETIINISEVDDIVNVLNYKTDQIKFLKWKHNDTIIVYVFQKPSIISNKITDNFCRI